MDFKKVFFISLFLLILSVSFVSAADLNNSHVSQSSDVIGVSLVYDDVGNVNIDDSKLSVATGNFNDLQKEINNAPAGSVLNLTRDYEGSDYATIVLNKDLTIDGQGHTIDCLEKDDCSAFYSSSGNIVLKNLRILNGHNDDNYKGGAIHIEDSAQYTLENCIFANNWADDYGGAIYNGVKKPLTIINCKFAYNEADDDDGGAIYSAGEVFIENSTFNYNSAYSRGGAIYSSNNIHINNCSFDSNKASGIILFGLIGGGALCAEGQLFVENSIFKDNSADNLGGAILCLGNDIFIKNSTFINNNGGNFGGAIFSQSKLFVENSTFKSNSVCGYGGAIYCDGGVQVDCSIFESNMADSSLNPNISSFGGAIFGSTVVINGSSFKKNLAFQQGGAVYAKSSVGVEQSIFESNNAKGAIICDCNGGAIRAEEDALIDNCTFDSNYAHDYGGAVYANDVFINKYQESGEFSSFFRKNTAGDDKGGAIFAGGVYAVNALFDENSAKVDGGAVYTEYNVDVRHCLFKSNRAKGAISQCYGGAIRAEEDALIDNCTFDSNYVYDYGGAVYANNVFINKNQESGEFSSFFINNTAGDDNGGAVYAEWDVSAVNALFDGNSAKVDGG
uniref:right-handed parallel beta-helix repeat-containing protein n=1 Tax=Methanobrevibacter sp. TaxID=66852 RepID=UPI003890A6E5